MPQPLTDNMVLLISPQPWDHIFISKHNYAMALVARGNQVIFVDPPTAALPQRSTLTPVADVPGLQVLRFRPPAWYRLRFHGRRLFDRLMTRHLRGLLRRFEIRPGVVWCFDFNLYSDLRVFGADLTVYHPVDPLSASQHLVPARSADLVLTVSQRIADSLAPAASSPHVINHGLAPAFERLARAQLDSRRERTHHGPLQAGFAGNLTRKPLDREALRKIVAAHPAVMFNFWGPCGDGSDPEVAGFVEFLEKAENARLHGAVSQSDLASAFADMDVFLLAYTHHKTESDLSNSHKLLEYMASGSVVVSHPVDQYADRPDLLTVPREGEELTQVFAHVVDNVDTYNSPDRRRVRSEFALQNTYAQQIERISALAGSLTTSVDRARAAV